jgi:hypothetical protein
MESAPLLYRLRRKPSNVIMISVELKGFLRN